MACHEPNDAFAKKAREAARTKERKKEGQFDSLRSLTVIRFALERYRGPSPSECEGEDHEERESDGGASLAHFQRFVSLTANIGRFSQELADLQESMRSICDMLAAPSLVQLDAALTF